jgi:hypothetical protein
MTAAENIGDGNEQSPDKCVQPFTMKENTFPIEFIGGSRDGAVIEATSAPVHYVVPFGAGMKEIYERKNNEPPFVYVQIGYAASETWK